MRPADAGLDGQATRINPSHTFRSAELAGETGEVYWQAITLLEDQSRTFDESDFGGFTLTGFDGAQINIRQGRTRSA